MGWHDTLSAARAVPLDGRALEEVVRATVGGRVVATVPMTGGVGSLLDLVDLAGGQTDRVVLRRLLPEFGDDGDVARSEHVTHDVVRAHGLRAPAVLWADPDGDRFGRPALLLEFVPGTPIVAELDRPEAQTAFADVIAAVHDVPTTTAPSRIPRLTDLASFHRRFGAPVITSDVVDARALATAVERLAAVFVPEDVFVHCDLHGGNVLWDRGAVTGIVDWTGAARGVRWFDEAYAVMDTTLAHGSAAGEGLRGALRSRPRVPQPDDDTWSLWTGVALVRALPGPRGWHGAFTASGCDVAADQLDQRYVAMVERYLDRRG